MANKTGLMKISLAGGILEADAKTGRIDLNVLEKIGNEFNNINNKDEKGYKRLSHWSENTATKEYISYVETQNLQTGIPVWEKTGRGRNTKTWASLHIAIDFAMWISPKFKYEVVNTFINDRILGRRMEGLELYKELMDDITRLPDYSKAKDHQRAGHIIREGIAVGGQGWDSPEQGADEQLSRIEIMKEMKTLIKHGTVNNIFELGEKFGVKLYK